jgi:hypothetical protein
MSAGDIVTDAWELYKAHWRHLLAIAFVVFLGIAVANAVLTEVLTWVGALISLVITLLGSFLVQGALVKAVEDVRDGKADLSLGDTLARVWPRIIPIVVAGIVAGIGIAIGFLLLIVPGLVLLTWWLLIVPVIVVENVGAADSFGRSRELVRGYGWNVLGVIVLTILVLLAAQILLALVLSPLADWIQGFVSSVVIGTVTTPFVAAAWTLTYFRLRELKEQAPEPGVSAPAV